MNNERLRDMKKTNILWHVLLAGILIAALLTVTIGASAEETAGVIASGYCGENVAWELDSNGILTISGEGEMSYPEDEEDAEN